jgi:hypothetical protein
LRAVKSPETLSVLMNAPEDPGDAALGHKHVNGATLGANFRGNMLILPKDILRLISD